MILFGISFVCNNTIFRNNFASKLQKLLVFVELYLNAYLQTDVQTGTIDNKDGQKFQAN